MEINRRQFLSLSAGGIISAAALANAKPAKASAQAAGTDNVFGMLVDTTLCVGCRACVVACKQWNHNPVSPVVDAASDRTVTATPLLDSNTFTNIRATEITQENRPKWIYSKIQCMHCDHPACAEACIVGALQKTPGGPVTYDEKKCIGCRYCQVACPFGIPTFEWKDPTPWIRKCTFCADRQAQGLQPACSGTCPTGALKFGTREDLLSEAKRRIADNPGLYVDHIYGEKEAGGTSWLYLASVPFEELEFAKLRLEPVTLNAARAMSLVPPVLVSVAAVMTGVYWLTKHRQRAGTEKKDDAQKPGVKQ